MENKISQESSQDWVEERLAEIDEIKDPSEKVEALLELASRLLPSPSEILEDALNSVKEIEIEKSRAKALAEIAPQLAETKRRHFLEKALNIAQKIEEKKYRTKLLAALIPQLPETLVPEFLKIILELEESECFKPFKAFIVSSFSEEIVAHIPDIHFSKALATVAQLKNEPTHQIKFFSALAPALPSQFLDRVLDMIKPFKDLGCQANVLCSLAPVMPHNKEKLLKFAENEIIHKTPPRFNQSFYEVKVWSCFREKQDEALNIAKNINKKLKYLRTEALVEIAAQLQALALHNSSPTELSKISTAQRDALTAISSLNNSPFILKNSPFIQSQHLQRLAPHLHPLQLLEAKNVAQQISKADYRAEALVALACHFPSIRQEVEQYIQKDIEQNNDKNTLTEIQGIKHLSTLAVEVPNILPDIIKRIEKIEKNSSEKEKNAHRYNILIALKPHFPARINREVTRVHRSEAQIPDELWNRSCKLLAKSYREILKKGSLRNESTQDEDYLNLQDELFLPLAWGKNSGIELNTGMNKQKISSQIARSKSSHLEQLSSEKTSVCKSTKKNRLIASKQNLTS